MGDAKRHPCCSRFWRFVVALQAFIDDSGRGQGPAFVLAGWIARPEAWAEFSTKWEETLHKHPRIEYFKMADAKTFKKQFDEWDESVRNKKVADLFAVIEDHVMYGVNVVVPRDLYLAYANNIAHTKIGNPYFLATYYLMVRLAEVQNIDGIVEPIDFIFDRQDDSEIYVRDAWDFIKEFSSGGIRRRLGKRPQFEDDRDFMPLQAADLHAWWLRRAYLSQADVSKELPFMWVPRKELKSIGMVISDENLRDFFSIIDLAMRSALTFTYEGHRFIQYRQEERAFEQPVVRLRKLKA
jgi:hypothetical protein